MSIDLADQYKKLSGWVAKNLHRSFHERHLDDCIQHVAMQSLEGKKEGEFEKYGIQGRWDWYLANYCRDNGLGNSNRVRATAKTIEIATSLTPKSEDEKEFEPEGDANEFNKDNFETRDALSFIFKNEEVLDWALSNLKKGVMYERGDQNKQKPSTKERPKKRY